MQHCNAAAVAPTDADEHTSVDAEEPTGRLALVRASGEEGAQAVEYAMIAGVGASVIGVIWSLIVKSDWFGKILAALLEALISLVKGWF